MIILTPDQWSRLNYGADRHVAEIKKREKDLTNFVKQTKGKEKNMTKPEDFNTYQSLFDRFVTDQRETREPVHIPIVGGKEEKHSERTTSGGTSFLDENYQPLFEDVERDEYEDISKPVKLKKRISAALPTFTQFKRGRLGRWSVKSTPVSKRKRKGQEVSPDQSLVERSPHRKTRKWLKLDQK